jgi:hypothetical protein
MNLFTLFRKIIPVYTANKKRAALLIVKGGGVQLPQDIIRAKEDLVRLPQKIITPAAAARTTKGRNYNYDGHNRHRRHRKVPKL